MKAQVVVRLVTAGARRPGLPRLHAPALQAALVVVGLMTLSGALWGPVVAHAAVAGKTYDLWMSFAPGLSTPPQHTCVRFTATTIQVDACGAGAGLLSETSVGPVSTTWNGQVPCGGLNVTFFGSAIDGLLVGLQVNVLAALVISEPGRLAIGMEGVENPACQ